MWIWSKRDDVKFMVTETWLKKSVGSTLQTDQTVHFMVYISKYTLLFSHNSAYFSISKVTSKVNNINFILY
jgi:hypothetical protein